MKPSQSIGRPFLPLLFFFCLAMTDLPVMAQQPSWPSVKGRLERLDTAYRAAYGRKDYKATEATLVEMAALLSSVATGDERERRQARQARASTWYNLACTYALTGRKKKAVEALAKAIDAGWTDYRHAKRDADFSALRTYKPFLLQLERLKPFDKLEILRAAAPYRHEQTDTMPVFTYALGSSDGRLRMVRDYFHLDSVAGKGDEWSRQLRLLHFVHDQVPHDGSNPATCEWDAIDIYHYAKATGRGVNCRRLAMMLCELYLAMDMPARYVTCMPADPDDRDRHVICAVWSRQWSRWLWVDPTFDAWVMDDHGQPLGIREVRQRLIDGRPLVLNDSANWNHRSRQTKEGYLETYMAKNLYWIVCPVGSTFNAESMFHDTGARYVSLLPAGFSSKKVTSDFCTSDPDCFWQKPPLLATATFGLMYGKK